MRTPVFTSKFKQDRKLAGKRNKDLLKLDDVISDLIDGILLPPKNRDHALSGNYVGRRECHIEPDWLLVYKVDDDLIIFERTGSHSDLFN